MGWIKRIYPFNAEQTVNILSEFGPLVTMFVVNAAFGIEAGTWALIGTTILAMVTMRMVLGQLPVFPIIASSVTVLFGTLTLLTGDPMWVQIKVTIFNALFAGFLFGGLWSQHGAMSRSSLWAVVMMTLLSVAAQGLYMTNGIPNLTLGNPVVTNLIAIGGLVVGFIFGGLIFRRNFFSYVFHKTFHFTEEGWNRFTFSFAWFFVFTAVVNEVVRQVFGDDEMWNVPLLGQMAGINIWILFKIAFIMPLSGLYAWYLTRLMQKYKIDHPATQHAGHAGLSDAGGAVHHGSGGIHSGGLQPAPVQAASFRSAPGKRVQ